MSESHQPVCPRHPDRVSYLRCDRCDLPACGECQIPTARGFVCAGCAVAQYPPGGASAEQARADEAGTAGPGAVDPEMGPRSGVEGAAGPTRTPVAIRRRHPVFTYWIAGICAAVYGLQLLAPTVTALGDFSPLTGYVQPWRFLTAAFLHSPETATHLVFNLLGLYVMGQFLEPAFGRSRFVAVYLLSALGGSVGYLLLTPDLIGGDIGVLHAWMASMVGASGAVFGLFGAALLTLRRTGSPIGGMVVLLGINVALPFFYPNIAWQAHLGGAVVGLLATAFVMATLPAARRRWTWPALLAVGLLVVAAAVIKYRINGAALAMLLPS